MKKILVIFFILALISAMLALPVSAGKYGPDLKADAQSWDRSEGDPLNAIDMYEGSLWHSLWNVDAAGEGFKSAENDYPQCLVIEFDAVHTIDRIGYMPRAGGITANGTMTAYEIWVSETKGIGETEDYRNDDGWTKVASSENCAPADLEFMNIDFDAVKCKSVKLKILKGVGGWASCAELQFGFTDVWYEPMAGFTPRTAVIDKPTEITTITETPTTSAPDPGSSASLSAEGETEAEPAATKDSGDNTILIVGIAGGAVIIIILVCIVVVSSKKKKKK